MKLVVGQRELSCSTLASVDSGMPTLSLICHSVHPFWRRSPRIRLPSVLFFCSFLLDSPAGMLAGAYASPQSPLARAAAVKASLIIKSHATVYWKSTDSPERMA